MKKGISLIVLVITIIVMIILAASVVITLSNTGIIEKAGNAVDVTSLKEVEQLASLTWAEEFMEGKRGETLKTAVLEKLKDYIALYKKEREFYKSANVRLLIEDKNIVALEYFDKDFNNVVIKVFTKNILQTRLHQTKKKNFSYNIAKKLLNICLTIHVWFIIQFLTKAGDNSRQITSMII
jgi:hypothetical protein